MPTAPPIVLSIAGFDPSSGAGVTADIKTAAAHGCYAVACITALTIQSTAGVRRVMPLEPELVTSTLVELATDFAISAVRIGMLGSAQMAAPVADFLERAELEKVVLDPVLKSSSGATLLDAEGVVILRERLLPLATVITPNLDEASALLGMPVTNLGEMRTAAHRLHEIGAENVVITGGDFQEGSDKGKLDRATDLLSFLSPQGTFEQQVFKAERQRSRSTHGTGCAYAMAIACHLAHGRALSEAVLLAKAFVAAAIANAHPLGRGIGPINHLYRMNQPPRRVVAHVDPEPVG